MNLPQSKNNCMAAPGLAIHGSASALVKYANTFSFKANGRQSPSITTADAPSLALATLVAPYPNGTASVAGSLADEYVRTYSLIATLPTAVPAADVALVPTFSWLAGPDISIDADPAINAGNIAQPNQSNQCLVGTVTVANDTGSAFVPGTTALDTANLTVTYQDNYAMSGDAF